MKEGRANSPGSAGPRKLSVIVPRVQSRRGVSISSFGVSRGLTPVLMVPWWTERRPSIGASRPPREDLMLAEVAYARIGTYATVPRLAH
jgi:hypothetical protein